MKRTHLWLALLAPAAAGAALAWGGWRWAASTRALHEKLDAARRRSRPRIFVDDDLSALPAPVQRYLRKVLRPGQPLVAAARVLHEGTFNMSDAGEAWRPFTSAQRVVVNSPGFVWDARISMAPGLTVRVHDAYVAGEGVLHATLFGLFPLADLRGTPEVAEGELMRFLAETAWYPTALLPGQSVRWHAVDERSADAELADRGRRVTLRFTFDEDGLLERVRAEARGRTVNGTVVPTPWEGRWRDYQVHDGMLVPLEGEVAWLLEGRRRPYWRGRIAGLAYQLEAAPAAVTPSGS